MISATTISILVTFSSAVVSCALADETLGLAPCRHLRGDSPQTFYANEWQFSQNHGGDGNQRDEGDAKTDGDLSGSEGSVGLVGNGDTSEQSSIGSVSDVGTTEPAEALDPRQAQAPSTPQAVGNPLFAGEAIPVADPAQGFADSRCGREITDNTKGVVTYSDCGSTRQTSIQPSTFDLAPSSAPVPDSLVTSLSGTTSSLGSDPDQVLSPALGLGGCFSSEGSGYGTPSVLWSDQTQAANNCFGGGSGSSDTGCESAFDPESASQVLSSPSLELVGVGPLTDAQIETQK